MQIRVSLKNRAYISLVAQFEPKRVDEALSDEFLIQLMKKNLDQLEINHG